jgi:hypothetical protein
MLSAEIAILKRKLAEIDADRAALIRSIAALEDAPLGRSRSGLPRGGGKKDTREAEPLPAGNTGIRDAVRRYLKHGELPFDELEKKIDADFPGLLQRSPRALETCLYKLVKRTEIEIRKDGTRKVAGLKKKADT